MMNSLLSTRRIVVLALGFVTAGALLWPIAYDDVELLSRSFLLPWAFAGSVVGLAGQSFLREQVVKTAVIVALGYACATFGRVVVEGVADPTSHNLWPFEVAIALSVGFAAGLLGGLLGAGLSSLARVTKRDSRP